MKKTKEPLDESEEESERVGLKLNIQKTKIMASGSITSWQIDEETVETVADFIFLGSKITECWVLKNWCFWTVVLEKTLENPLDCKEIQPLGSSPS